MSNKAIFTGQKILILKYRSLFSLANDTYCLLEVSFAGRNMSFLPQHTQKKKVSNLMAVLTYARYIAIILFHTKELKLNNIISLMIRLILNVANTYHNFLKLFSYVVGYALPLQVCLLLMNIPLGDPITKKFVKSNTLDRQSHAYNTIYIYMRFNISKNLL